MFNMLIRIAHVRAGKKNFRICLTKFSWIKAWGGEHREKHESPITHDRTERKELKHRKYCLKWWTYALYVRCIHFNCIERIKLKRWLDYSEGEATNGDSKCSFVCLVNFQCVRVYVWTEFQSELQFLPTQMKKKGKWKTNGNRATGKSLNSKFVSTIRGTTERKTKCVCRPSGAVERS